MALASHPNISSLGGLYTVAIYIISHPWTRAAWLCLVVTSLYKVFAGSPDTMAAHSEYVWLLYEKVKFATWDKQIRKN